VTAAPQCHDDGLPEEAYAAAVATLGFGATRLASLLAEHGPRGAWASAASAWRGTGGASLSGDDAVADVWAAHVAANVRVHLLGSDAFPERLAADHQPPAVLFSRGSLDALGRPSVSIVGTRRCTHTGRQIARQLGRELAAAGISVVSGLALGIDGAAHEGALAAGGAPPIGVVGSGLDVVYPRRHEQLWNDVATAGLLLSEVPLGGRPEPWRFPARNRIIAALADVVVVVESHAAGGSLHTVRAAIERGVTVMAVPGSVRNPAAAGCNLLIADGVAPACDSEDILVALGLATIGDRRGAAAMVATSAAGADGAADPPVPAGDDLEVLEAVGWEPTSFEEILDRTGLAPAAAALALRRLEDERWVHRDAGWFERVRR
jgi:DNA processing protein